MDNERVLIIGNCYDCCHYTCHFEDRFISCGERNVALTFDEIKTDTGGLRWLALMDDCRLPLKRECIINEVG